MNDTIKGNVLIAEFMGMAYDNHDNQPNPYWELTDEQPFTSNKPYPQNKHLKFHNSWNWLIPVVKKIREIINVDLSIDQYFYITGAGLLLNPYEYGIEEVFEAAVEFIQWYNKQL